ncbi:MAG: hypothetical protein AAF228_08425 [Pseudomonadota bacterium]
MRFISIIRASFYGLCGFAAYSIDQFMNYEFMIGLEDRITSLVIAVPIAGLLCSISWAALGQCFKHKDIPNAVLLICVFASLAVFSLGASIYRAGEAYDQRYATIHAQNAKIYAAENAVSEAKADWQRKQQAVEQEIAQGGCGPVCRDKKTLANEAKQHYETAQSKRAVLGSIHTTDPMAARLASLFGLPVTLVQTIYPMMLPLGIWLASIVFIGLAVNELNVVRAKPQESNANPVREITPEPPDQTPEPNLKPLLFSMQVQRFMQQQEQLDGKRPTHAEAAHHFGVSRSTITRHLAKVK